MTSSHEGCRMSDMGPELPLANLHSCKHCGSIDQTRSGLVTGSQPSKMTTSHSVQTRLIFCTRKASTMLFMPKLKPPSRFQSALAIFGAVVLANAALWGVLSSNLTRGIYSADADSISIPIGFAFADSMLILLLGVSGSLLPQRRIGWRIAACLLLLVAGLLGTELAYRWFYPNHYLAGSAFLLVPIVCALSLWKQSSATHPC